MRALPVVVILATVLAVAYLLSLGGHAGTPELAPVAAEGPAPSVDLAAIPREADEPANRVDVAEGGDEGDESVEEVLIEGQELTDSFQVDLVVLMLTPTGQPLAEALRELRGRPGSRPPRPLRLAALVSREAPEIGATIPYLPYRQDGSPFLENRWKPPIGYPPGTTSVMSFDGAERPVFVCALANRRVLAVQLVDQDVGEVTFVLTPEEALSDQGGIRVCFVDEAGGPVEGVGLNPHNRHSAPEASSDSMGCAQIALLEPGFHDLDAFHHDFAPTRFRFILAAGQQLDLGTVVLRQPVTIRGHLVGPPTEITGREVQLCRIPFHGLLSEDGYDWRTTTDAEGRFELGGLEPREYILRVTLRRQLRPGSHHRSDVSWLSGYLPVDVRSGDSGEVSLTLELKHRVRVRTHFPPGTEIGLRVLDAAGFALEDTSLCPDDCEIIFDLPAGALRLEVRNQGVVRTMDFDALDGAVLDVGP